MDGDFDIVEFFCRHLIGIAWYEGLTGHDGAFSEVPVFYGASGFLLELVEDSSESVALITAGHVFTDHNSRMQKSGMGTQGQGIFDAWGPLAPEYARIPFEIFDSGAVVLEQPSMGLDVAIVPLPYLIRLMLQATTIPFTRTNWINQHNVEIEFHAILGLPNEEAFQSSIPAAASDRSA